jgi:hypothetical protein
MLTTGDGVTKQPGNGWSVAIVSSRESVDILRSALEAVLKALGSAPTTIDLVVNGNRQLAVQMAAALPELQPSASCPVSIRLWHIAVADKAHAWNQYLHLIWPQSDVAYFVDGYAQVAPDSLGLLNQGLDNRPDAWAISGVPTVGRTAKSLRQEMIEQSGGHGTLHALRGNVCLQLRQRGFRIPLGLYRVDGLIFALVAFALDPAANSWDTTRTVVHPDVTWTFRPLAWWRLSDLRTYGRRLLRQAQGDLENRAIRQHLAVQKRAPESLPATCSELVLSWWKASPSEVRAMVLRNPLRFIAARKLRRWRDWSLAKSAPELLAERNFVQVVGGS